MININKKFIFIHVPKTGGSSITQSLLLDEKIELGPRSYDGLSLDTAKKFFGTHAPNFQHLKLGPLLRIAPKAEGFFKFIFCRNPFARILSEYFYCISHNGCKFSGNRRDFLQKYPSFREFILDSAINKCSWTPHADSQYSFIKGHEVDFIGKFENLQEDFNIICDKIGLPRRTLPHKNASKHKHYAEYYDDETRQIVAEKYAKDIEYFGYKFGE